MNIRVFNKLENGVYRVSIHTESWSEGDKLAISRGGEPTVDLGGDFTCGAEDIEFSLPHALSLIMSESPFTQCFDFRDFTDAQERAVCWKSEIVGRISDAVMALRDLHDTFTREEVIAV